MVRSYVMRALPLVLLICIGAVVLAVAGDGTAGLAIGLMTIGTAVVLLVALFFYEVGRSEDRDRASRRSE
jgi:ABC-type transport system involved in cytochrome bd biosynthesis fused ATPase/permease subunit